MKIEAIANGYIVTTSENEYGSKLYFGSVVELVRFINDEYEPGSRHSDKRVYVIEAPGDKHPDFTDKHSDVIWPEED